MTNGKKSTVPCNRSQHSGECFQQWDAIQCDPPCGCDREGQPTIQSGSASILSQVSATPLSARRKCYNVGFVPSYWLSAPRKEVFSCEAKSGSNTQIHFAVDSLLTDVKIGIKNKTIRSRSDFGFLYVTVTKKRFNKLTVASSEQDAITWSLKGFHLMSSTGPACPHTRAAFMSTRPVWK